MPEPIYELQRVRKIYEERCVLSIEELRVERGEILAVVGPSGAGKSTLLRLLNFLEEPSEGRISFDGHCYDVGDVPPIAERRRITTVFQRPILLKRSVYDNTRYGLQLRGSRDSRRAIGRVLEAVGLSKLAKQDATRLSGGEAQRVALARAMILKPDVLLMDEPTANLDPQNVALIERIARRLNESQKTTIVLVTHNIFQARRLSHRVAFFLDGELIEASPTESVFVAPQDARTAAFVAGDMVY